MKKLLVLLTLCGTLAACDSGDINISPATTDNRVDSSTNNSNNPDNSVTIGGAGDTVASTTLSAAANAGDTTLMVTSTANFANGQAIVVELADGSNHTTTIASFIANQSVTLASALPSVAAASAMVTVVGSEVENPCASYMNTGGQTLEGRYDGVNCTYAPSFADAGNNLRADVFIPELPGGVHIFQGSLFVGEAHANNAELQAAGIAEGGDGPTLTIEAGATLAWPDNTKFFIVNRGSQIFAVGTADKPITLTATKDAVDGAAGPEEVQLWGGVVINGFGVTNKCGYTGSRGVDLVLVGECNVAAEGAEGLDESFYGGDNDNDSSGRMEYVIVKHTGAQVANGDELNGVSFGGVGRNTIVRNVQVYSTYDDGYEMFGGAVNVENFVAMYVRDDSIDVDEGYIGTFTNSLIIQNATDGNRCIEADGIGSFSSKTDAFIADQFARGLNSRPTINNLTCILSPSTGTHDPGAGFRLREGLWPTINNALVIGSFSAATEGDDNWCVRIDDVAASEGFALGNASINNSVFACETKSDKEINGMAVHDFLIANGGNVFADVTGTARATAVANTELQLLGGTPPFYALARTDMVLNDAGLGDGANVGALIVGQADWATGWAYGLVEGNRGQALWFESL